MSREWMTRDFEVHGPENPEPPEPATTGSRRIARTDRQPIDRLPERPGAGIERLHRSARRAPEREVFSGGRRLTASQVRTIVELGRFRLIAEADLGSYIYGRERQALDNDIASLAKGRLVAKGCFAGPEGSPRELITLTKRGRRLLLAYRLVRGDQTTYAGFRKPRDANHEADLYRMYHKEADRIERGGGRVRRVVLDSEIKRNVNRDLSKFGRIAQSEIAARHGLRMVGEKIPVPDLQIEYEDGDRGIARVNLELVTLHYSGLEIAEKAQAGFSLYTPRGEGQRLERALHQRQLRAEVRSL